MENGPAEVSLWITSANQTLWYICQSQHLDFRMAVKLYLRIYAYTLKNKKFFVGIYGLMKDLYYLWNQSIVQKVLCNGKGFFTLFFTLINKFIF